MKFLILGDVMGKPGRQLLDKHLPQLREEYSPDFVLLNGENSAGGKGLTEKIYQKYIDQEIDAVTMGNHWMDKPEIHDFFPKSDRLLLPANMANVENDYFGLKIFHMSKGAVAVINLIGKVFMQGQNRCPFKTLEKLLASVPPHIKMLLVDIHAEATSEKQALGHFLDGRASLVFGTHSHVPTADSRILKGGTGFITDVGMTGPYDSVIGIRKEAAILRMQTGVKKRFEPAKGDPRLYGILAEVDEQKGTCLEIAQVVRTGLEMT
jgi:2',3'-cyclic-nucleotide 2'-phosphodiesterase